MSTVTKCEPIEHDVMEARLSETSVHYVEATVNGRAWRCDGCGLVWPIRWHAEKCEQRGHVASFVQRYSNANASVNGVPARVGPSGQMYPVEVREYVRQSLRRDPTPQP